MKVVEYPLKRQVCVCIGEEISVKEIITKNVFLNEAF